MGDALHGSGITTVLVPGFDCDSGSPNLASLGSHVSFWLPLKPIARENQTTVSVAPRLGKPKDGFGCASFRAQPPAGRGGALRELRAPGPALAAATQRAQRLGVLELGWGGLV